MVCLCLLPSAHTLLPSVRWPWFSPSSLPVPRALCPVFLERHNRIGGMAWHGCPLRRTITPNCSCPASAAAGFINDYPWHSSLQESIESRQPHPLSAANHMLDCQQPRPHYQSPGESIQYLRSTHLRRTVVNLHRPVPFLAGHQANL